MHSGMLYDRDLREPEIVCRDERGSSGSHCIPAFGVDDGILDKRNNEEKVLLVLIQFC